MRYYEIYFKTWLTQVYLKTSSFKYTNLLVDDISPHKQTFALKLFPNKTMNITGVIAKIKFNNHKCDENLSHMWYCIMTLNLLICVYSSSFYYQFK